MTAPSALELARAQMLVETPIRRANVDMFELDVLSPIEVCGDLRARPVDPNMVRRLAALHLDDIEIATALDMPLDQMLNTYGTLIAQGRNDTVVALKRVRLRVAMRGNVQMLMHLGEKLLGEKKAPNVNVNVNLDVDDPKTKLLNAINEAATRLAGVPIKELPSAELVESPDV